jgi:adenylate cyclase
MLVFPDAGSAAEGAVLLLRSAAEAGLPALHIGIATGPLVERDGDYYGRTVNLASRMSAAAAAGEILVDEPTRDRLGAAHAAEPIGTSDLKGIATAVPLYRLAVDTAGGRP